MSSHSITHLHPLANFDVVLVNLLGKESKDAAYLEGSNYNNFPDIRCTVKRMLRSKEEAARVHKHFREELFGYDVSIEVQIMKCQTVEERERIQGVIAFVTHKNDYRPSHDHIVLNKEDVDDADDSCWDKMLNVSDKNMPNCSSSSACFTEHICARTYKSL